MDEKTPLGDTARRERAAEPWVIVAAGVHNDGGMDRANAALARYLLALGHRVHLVTHRIDQDIAAHPLACVHLVSKAWGSFLAGEVALRRAGRRVARQTTADEPDARVVVNGGNCDWPDVNWVHYVHAAARCYDAGAPAWFKAKNRIAHLSACLTERRSLRRARIIISNSWRTNADIAEHLGIEQEAIDLVYLGSECTWRPPDVAERVAARSWLRVPGEVPLVTFVGAIGHDQRKGFDTLWAAWQSLCRDPDWDAVLVVAGAGRALGQWRRTSLSAGMSDRIRFLGFTRRVRDLLAGVDLLVSPVRYESYGLNVQEAICRGVPALVTRTAGAAERYGPAMQDMLIDDVEDAAELERRLRAWRGDVDGWKRRCLPLSEQLRAYTWDAMAADIVALANARRGPRTPSGN